MAKKKVWVVGHKHPDTDSICAAISYANLKNEIEKKNPKTATGMTYIAKRAGSVNAETAYVLERFHAEAPAMISDVGTQIKDIQIRRTEGVNSHISMKKAWEMMVQLNRAALSNRIEYLSTTASNHKMIHVIDYLNAHLTDDITIDFLAEHFYLSRYHLMHAFKEETGYTIGNYLTTKRLLLARDQIAQGESITTACYACGFHNYSTFSRAYRKHFGCSPREQRN